MILKTIEMADKMLASDEDLQNKARKDKKTNLADLIQTQHKFQQKMKQNYFKEKNQKSNSINIFENNLMDQITVNLQDQQERNRYLVHTIDSVFQEEIRKHDEFPKKISQDISQWARNHDTPFNVETVIMKRELELKQRQEKEEARMIYQVWDDQTETRKLADQFHIDLSNISELINRKNEVSKFCEDDNAYLMLKQNPNLNNTIQKHNKFIEDEKTKKKNKKEQNQVIIKAINILKENTMVFPKRKAIKGIEKSQLSYLVGHKNL